MTPVKPERIIKDLNRLWVDLGKQDAAGVLRACAMTLIAVVDEGQDPTSLGETLAALMHEHPSRLILLRAHPGDEPHLEANVTAQCWLPFGKRQQICCEQIEITSSLGSLADVVSVVRGLIAPDLPVVIYCPSQDLWRLNQFQQLLPLANKLILDSTSMRGSLKVLDYLNALPRSNGILKADLAWSRLTPWRESIAQIFEDPVRRRSIYDLSEVRILYKSDDEPAAVYYLAGWFMHLLGAGVKLNIARGVGPEFCCIGSISLIGPNLQATVELVESSTVEVTLNDERQQVGVYPPMNDYEALRHELAVPGRDMIFEDVLRLAHLMRSGS